MKINWKKGISLLVITGTLLAFGCSSATEVYQEVDEQTMENIDYSFKLSPDVVNQSIESCKDSKSWGLGLATININYRTGVGIEAAVVLHNGNDADRWIEVTFLPQQTTMIKQDAIYESSPAQTKDWVIIKEQYIRLKPMETKVVKVLFGVPEEKELPDRWMFFINARGVAIQEFSQNLTNVNTIAGDTILELKLANSLFLDSTLSVIKVSSTLVDDNLNVTKYDPSTQILTIEGLKELSTREMTITYECTMPIQVAYNQTWLIDMVE